MKERISDLLPKVEGKRELNPELKPGSHDPSPVLISFYPFSRKNGVWYQTQKAIVSPVHDPFIHLAKRH